MHTLVIEGVIEFAECLLVGVATIKRSVVFARHKVNRWDFQCADNVFELRHAVFANLHVVGGVSEIAGKDYEVRLFFQAVHGLHRFL